MFKAKAGATLYEMNSRLVECLTREYIKLLVILEASVVIYEDAVVLILRFYWPRSTRSLAPARPNQDR